MLRQIALADTGLHVSEMAFGAMAWDTAVTFDAALALYDAYRAAGGNIFDTAHVYAAWRDGGIGASEKSLGNVVRARGEEGKVLIMTKGGHPAFMPWYPRPDRYLAPEVVRQDIRESLQRLEMPRVDLFLLHRDDRRVPVGEIIGLLNEEAKAGRIGHFGVSNWRATRIEEANAYARAHGLKPFACSQPQFSLALPNAPESENDVDGRFLTPADIAWHEQSQMPSFCYSPTANGYFASAGKLANKSYENPTTRARLTRAQQLAAKRNGKSGDQGSVTPNQIALAWMRAQKFPAIPLLGTGNLAHLADALAATDIRMDAQEIQWLTNG